MIDLVEHGQIETQPGLYTEQMVEVGKRFFEEVFAQKPSKEFQRWLDKESLHLPFPLWSSRSDRAFSREPASGAAARGRKPGVQSRRSSREGSEEKA
jgi:hypothetical protein